MSAQVDRLSAAHELDGGQPQRHTGHFVETAGRGGSHRDPVLDTGRDSAGGLLQSDGLREQAGLPGQARRAVGEDRQAVVGCGGIGAEPVRQTGEGPVQQLLHPLTRDRDRLGEPEPCVVERDGDGGDVVVAGRDGTVLVDEHDRAVAGGGELDLDGVRRSARAPGGPPRESAVPP